jgi:hypothetical protein
VAKLHFAMLVEEEGEGVHLMALGQALALPCVCPVVVAAAAVAAVLQLARHEGCVLACAQVT